VELAGRTALVTGGASGLGAATAEILCSAGARTVIVDLPGSRGAETAGTLGGAACFVPGDVTSEQDVARAIATVAGELGGLHIAVSCAGVVAPGRILGKDGPLSLESFARVVEVNLVGTFNVLRLAAAQMASQEPIGEERGVIVNTASIAAFEGQIGQPAYAASKAGVVGLTLPAARELAAQLIRVVAVAPGVFETPMVSGLPERVRDDLARSVPHPSRTGKPAEYAALVRHIVENPMLNGCVLRLDGALRLPPR
jgi:NAD(P)-dependent dehydrogenase (short-subunit alcohol dehydrogenase family)